MPIFTILNSFSLALGNGLVTASGTRLLTTVKTQDENLNLILPAVKFLI